MGVEKPLAINLSTKDASPSQFAARAADVLRDNDRVDVEPTTAGLTLRAVWEFDMDQAIAELVDMLGFDIEHEPPEIHYRREPRLLEPIMRVRLAIPENSVDEVIDDLNQRRAHIPSIAENNDGFCRIECLVPLANTFGYFYALQRLTAGRAKVDVDFHGYDPVSPGDPEPDPNKPIAAALRLPKMG